jgi:hypothetical protein
MSRKSPGRGGLSPVKGFWSVTMYDANYFFVANPINRYSISARIPTARSISTYN